VRVPPPLVFAGAIVVGMFLPDLRPSLLASAAAGALLIVVGVGLGGWAVGWFRRTGQDLKPWTPTTELIVRGPYRFSRNPIYLAMMLVTLGIGGLLARGWIAVLALLALLIVHFSAVLPEERYLEEKFGEPYRQYKASVRRYL
jgi:protein-S-isoprenylcysteine O-methyltransferase Ste14